MGEKIKMSETFVFPNDLIYDVLGSNDRNLSYLELILGTDLIVRGNSVTAINSSPLFRSLMSRLESAAKERGELTESEICMEAQLTGDELKEESCEEHQAEDNLKIKVLSKTVWPKSSAQKRMLKALKSSSVVFASGPAGTGKTYLAIAWALSLVLGGEKGRIVLTRPVVEAGESLGFLPGDLSQKLGPFLAPLYDAMSAMISPSQIKRLEESGAIEIAPLAYMRGRSLNNAVVILDEAQNATSLQMKMFLTRLGENSQAIVAGDPSQIDLPIKRDSGFLEAVRILDGIEGVSMVRFSEQDTVRSRVVREIVKAYLKENNSEKII